MTNSKRLKETVLETVHLRQYVNRLSALPDIWTEEGWKKAPQLYQWDLFTVKTNPGRLTLP